jgi:glycosyltransferase involved in cell wall biosynthesis
MSRSLAVVIPTFNRAHTIRRAVDSVLASPLADIELAVVDDCSTDATGDILAAIADSRLKVLRTSTSGRANLARNNGARSTTAPLLAFLDSDDEFLPGRIERLIRFFAENPAVDAVLDGFQVWNGRARRLFSPPPSSTSGAALVDLLVCHALPLTNSVLAMRRSAFEDVEGFDPELRRHQDRDMLLRLARRHEIAIGTAADVVKHQSVDSFSRHAAGYISGLDDLVARHDAFLAPRHRDILGYLTARVILREVAAGRLVSALNVLRAISAARHLPFGTCSALTRYASGRRIRKQAEQAVRAAAGNGSTAG